MSDMFEIIMHVRVRDLWLLCQVMRSILTLHVCSDVLCMCVQSTSTTTCPGNQAALRFLI